MDQLGAMSLQDRYKAAIVHISKYPHRIDFDLAQFRREHWTEEVRASEIIKYRY